MISIKIKGIEELVSKIDTLKKFNRVRAVISQQGVFLMRQMRRYPNKVYSPNPLIKSDPKVRRGFFYHLKHGDIKVPYSRTKLLANHWTVYSSRGGFAATVENNMAYAPLVQGWEEQTRGHKWSGWLTDKGAINVYGPQIQSRIIEAVEKEIAEF